jgi:O-antigen biosynthesis protein
LTLTVLTKIQRDLDIEIIVVDNNSTDMYTFDFLGQEFPKIRFIKNEVNSGFGEANNIAMKEANSENLLILNPDTIISREVLESSVKGLENENIGAVAVKMIDGSGDFLPESKRGFPKLSSTLYKFIGLHRLLPKSQIFNQYYIGSIEDKRFIEVLAGACFFIRKKVYEEIGGFDKRFFMYGEDIDLSYQLSKRGYRIAYQSDIDIVHFKGKSSSKIKWSYHSAFYNAMLIYWKKNIQASKNIFQTFLISFVLFGLKVLSIFKHLLIAVFWPLLDAVTIYFSIAILSKWWAICIKLDSSFFPSSFYTLILPIYTLVWIFSLFVSNFYQNSIEIQRLFKGATLGTILTLILYFMLPSEFKFSRGILIISIALKFLLPLFLRVIWQLFSNQKIQLSETALFNAKFIPEDFRHVKFLKLLKECSSFEIINSDQRSNNLVIEIEAVDNSEMIDIIRSKKHKSVWLYSSKGNYLIQSLGKHERGNVIAEDTNLNIQNFSSRFLKRLLDIIFSIFVLGISFFQYKMKNERVANALKVLGKGWTWISIENSSLRSKFNVKNGIYTPTKGSNPNSDVEYLRHYSVQKEFSILLKQMFKL